MSLLRLDSYADAQRLRRRMLDQAEGDLLDAAEAAVRRLLARMRAAVTSGALTAAANPPLPPTSDLFTMGQVAGWWQAAIADEVTDAVRRAWELGYYATTTDPLGTSSLNAAGDYLAAVTDRLSRTITPTIPEQAFDVVRVAMADEIGRGSSIPTISRRLASDLNWQGPDVGLWQSRLDDLNRQIDNVLDPIGPPGHPAREAMRMNDPTVANLQAQRTDIVKRLDADETVWQTRARTIARTEAVGATNAGSLDAAVRAGAGVKVWIATGDNRTRDSHLWASGQCVPVDQPFTIGGVALQMPGDPAGAAGETINCRCTMIFDTDCGEASGVTAEADEIIDSERARREREHVTVGVPSALDAPAPLP